MTGVLGLVFNPSQPRWVPQQVSLPPPPPPGGRQVLVQVEEVGICQLDQLLLLHREGKPPEHQRWVIGHEMVGRVVRPGRRTSLVKTGDWVVPLLRLPCGVCGPCADGSPDECVTDLYKEPGLHRAHGWACQVRVEEEENLVPIPPSLGEVALLVEPLALAIKGANTLAKVQQRTLPSCAHFGHRWDQTCWMQDKHFLIIGSSVLTVLTALYMRLLDAAVTLLPCHPMPSEMASPLADLGVPILNPQEATVDHLHSLDGVLETSGDPLALAPYMDALAPNGVVVFLARPSGQGRRHAAALATVLERALRSNIGVVPCYRMGRSHMVQAIQWLDKVQRNGSFPLRLLLAPASPPEEFFPLACTPKPWVKNRIRWSEPPGGPGAL